MVSTHALWTFAVTAFLLIVIPGPSVMFVVSRGVALGRRAAALTVVGNAAGAYTQVLLVAAGLALPWALLAAVALNLVAVVLAAQRLKRLVPLLRLPATRRHLTISPSTAPARHERHDEHGPAAGQPAAR